MKKQQLPLSLGFVLILLTCLISAPLRVYAGSANVVGASDDSSSSAGDNVSPITSEPIVEAVPGTNVEVNNGGDSSSSDINISASAEVQNNVNEAANEILQQAENANTVLSIIMAILQGDSNAETSVNQLENSLGNLGVSTSAMQGLMSALRGMISKASASTSNVDMVSLKAVQLVANVKNLRTEIAQDAAKPSVDLNKLNAAITAYNNIVMESSPEVVQKLAKDPQFLEIGKVLKQLRSALNKR